MIGLYYLQATQKEDTYEGTIRDLTLRLKDVSRLLRATGIFRLQYSLVHVLRNVKTTVCERWYLQEVCSL